MKKATKAPAKNAVKASKTPTEKVAAAKASDVKSAPAKVNSLGLRSNRDATAPKEASAKDSKTPVKASRTKLTPEEEAAQKALIIIDEASKHANAIATLNVDDVSQERAAVKFRVEVIKEGIKQVKDIFDSIVKKAKETYDEARGKRDKVLEPYEQADRLVLDALNGYYTRQKERVREEQARADREQQEREQQAVINRAREKALLEERIADQLAQLPDDAPQELIEKIQEPLQAYESPVPIVPYVRVSEPERSGSVVQQDNWRGEIVAGYEMAVLKQVVEGTLPISLIEFRGPEMNKLAKLYQDKKSFPGLRFWNASFVRGVGGR